jgi:hypothetical protein
MCQAVAVLQGVKIGKILAERFARTVVKVARIEKCLFCQENPDDNSPQKSGIRHARINPYLPPSRPSRQICCNLNGPSADLRSYVPFGQGKGRAFDCDRAGARAAGGQTPLESMPVFLQNLMQFVPSTHFVSFSQAVLFRNATLAMVWPDMAKMFAIGSVYTLYSLSRFRKMLAAVQ